MPYFSIIVPVYNRPEEVKELAESLKHQTLKDFELVIVEDGSSTLCSEVLESFKNDFTIRYFFKENSGRSFTRNYGMERAEGEYFVFFDSDCIIPTDYFRIVKSKLEQHYTDCYGGPDKACESFSDLQKAISFSMTSFLTTGGIRGSKKGLEKFTPRTFNMGFSREVYQKVGDFKDMFGEDIDLSLRIRDAGFSTQLISDAFVYHKRRVSFRSFYKQVHVFGMARIELFLLHINSLKAVHLLPALFTLGSAFLLFLSLWNAYVLVPLLLYFIAIFVSASIVYKKISIGTLSVITSAIQLYGYGWGFIKAFIKKIILRRRNEKEKELEKYYKKK